MEAIPLVFYKTYEQRLQELLEILYDECSFKRLWVNYLEYFVEPVGWQALWKLSRQFCTEFRLNFPTNVVVVVDGVNFNDLTANVTVTNVESAIDIPKKFQEVPLIEFYPIVDEVQERVMLIKSTAEAIDNLRIFYCHLIYPWEVEENDTNWVSVNLENRLRLHYDVISSKIFHETVDELTNLIRKGKETYEEIKRLEEEVSEDEDNATNEMNTMKLFQLNHELEHIKNKLTIFDNSNYRNLKMKENRANLLKLRENHNNYTAVALVNENVSELYSCFSKLNCNFPNSYLRLNPLQQALNELIPDETIWVGPGIHHLSNSRGLQERNTCLKGIMGTNKCIISEAQDNWILFDLHGENVKFEDVTIQSNRVKHLIVIRRGSCHLDSVMLQGSHYAVGVVVHPGASLTAVRCNFGSCTKGIIASPRSTVSLRECTFNNNNVAVEVQEDAKIILEDCTISDSTEYAVKYSQSVLARKEGNLELLSVSDSITIKNLELINNSGNVLIYQIHNTL